MGPLASPHWFCAFGLEPSLQRLWRSSTRLLAIYRAELLWIYTAPLPTPYPRSEGGAFGALFNRRFRGIIPVMAMSQLHFDLVKTRSRLIVRTVTPNSSATNVVFGFRVTCPRGTVRMGRVL